MQLYVYVYTVHVHVLPQKSELWSLKGSERLLGREPMPSQRIWPRKGFTRPPFSFHLLSSHLRIHIIATVPIRRYMTSTWRPTSLGKAHPVCHSFANKTIHRTVRARGFQELTSYPQTAQSIQKSMQRLERNGYLFPDFRSDRWGGSRLYHQVQDRKNGP